MSGDQLTRIPVRARFWPRYFRWAITFQFGPLLLFGLNAVFKGIRGDWALSVDFFLTWGVISVVLALLSLYIAVRRRNLGCAELTPPGIRPYTTRHGWDIRYRWSELETVRVKAGPFGNRWLEVVPTDAPPFKLTARPHDPLEILDAFERFAGPDHPLTLAMAEVTEGGR